MPKTKQELDIQKKLFKTLLPGYETCSATTLFNEGVQTDLTKDEIDERINEFTVWTPSESQTQVSEIDVITSDEHVVTPKDEAYVMPDFIGIKFSERPRILLKDAKKKTTITIDPENLDLDEIKLKVSDWPIGELHLSVGGFELFPRRASNLPDFLIVTTEYRKFSLDEAMFHGNVQYPERERAAWRKRERRERRTPRPSHDERKRMSSAGSFMNSEDSSIRRVSIRARTDNIHVATQTTFPMYLNGNESKYNSSECSIKKQSTNIPGKCENIDEKWPKNQELSTSLETQIDKNEFISNSFQSVKEGTAQVQGTSHKIKGGLLETTDLPTIDEKQVNINEFKSNVSEKNNIEQDIESHLESENYKKESLSTLEKPMGHQLTDDKLTNAALKRADSKDDILVDVKGNFSEEELINDEEKIQAINNQGKQRADSLQKKTVTLKLPVEVLTTPASSVPKKTEKTARGLLLIDNENKENADQRLFNLETKGRPEDEDTRESESILNIGAMESVETRGSPQDADTQESELIINIGAMESVETRESAKPSPGMSSSPGLPADPPESRDKVQHPEDSLSRRNSSRTALSNPRSRLLQVQEELARPYVRDRQRYISSNMYADPDDILSSEPPQKPPDSEE